jgi:hypothetical protein
MLSSLTKEISNTQMNLLKDTAMNNSIPYSLGIFGGNGCKHRTIRYKSENESVRVQVLPKKPSQTVERSQPTEVPCYAVVVDDKNDQSGVVSTEQYGQLEFLPSLRQSYCEGDSYRDREADYRYHFTEDETEVAVPASNPVQRLENPITISAVEFLGGFAPKKWLLETDSGDGLYLRERSGSIRLYDQVSGGEEIFNAYIGREHPGTPLKTNTRKPSEDEVLKIVTSVNYINLDKNIQLEVSEETREEYDKSVRETFERNSDIDLDDPSEYLVDN